MAGVKGGHQRRCGQEVPRSVLLTPFSFSVVAADSLAKRDVFRLPDPFAVITVDGEQTNTTSAIKVRHLPAPPPFRPWLISFPAENPQPLSVLSSQFEHRRKELTLVPNRLERVVRRQRQGLERPDCPDLRPEEVQEEGPGVPWSHQHPCRQLVRSGPWWRRQVAGAVEEPGTS